MICVNCNKEHTSQFCPNCGEKSTVPKITFGSIINDGLSTITNMDKGFLFNLKNLFLDPNKTVKDYIKGKRKNIFNPISYLLITITIYLIIDSLIVVDREVNEINSEIYSVGYEAGRFIKLYLKYFWILSIVWLSFSTKLVFRQYNYAEHLAINSFVIGQSTLVGLVVFVITKIGLLFNPIVYLSIIWMTYKIFKNKNKDSEIFFQSIASTLLFFIQLICNCSFYWNNKELKKIFSNNVHSVCYSRKLAMEYRTGPKKLNIKMRQNKVVLLDLGGVVFQSTGVSNQKINWEVITKLNYKYGHDLNIGEDRFPAFLKDYNQLTGQALAGQEFLKEVFDTLELNTELIELVKEVGDIVIVSDNYRENIEYISKRYHFNNWSVHQIYSFNYKMVKSHPDFFKKVKKEIKNYEAEEMVLIDDSKEKIESAEKCGIKGILYIDNNQVRKDLGEQ